MLSLDDLFKNIESYNKEDREKIKKAYDLAEYLHKDQFRQSGEPYIIHPLTVAYILSELKADSDTICAGLLHDTLEDTNIAKDGIASEFNETIAELVDGVTKISKMNFSTKEDQNMANTRKIITSIRNDVRIIIIKLADRLHNMRTLQFKSELKQKENAAETMDIFVPLAYYIGAYRIKSELEDLSLMYTYPDTYREIEEIQHNQVNNSKKCLQEMHDKLKYSLNEKNISNEIKIRIKNVYGIYKRLEEHNKLSDIHDLLSLKIIVDKIPNCYLTLGLIHDEYLPINDKFKDYICNPKTNMYQSLHTTVFAPDNRLVQTQIRTFDMDKVASFGLTALWNINDENSRNIMQQKLRDEFQFYKSLKEIDKLFEDNNEFVSQVKTELFSDRIYVYTPKGNVIELPKGATAIDFAYKIHTKLGNTMTLAVVNNKYVPAGTVLSNRDRVRIITDDLSFGPRDEWIDCAVTAKAKRKIKEFNKK